MADKKTLALILFVLVATSSAATRASQADPIEIYVTPFYSSDGPQVNVGQFSEGLASADRDAIRQTVGAMQQKVGSLPVVAMYVAAIRLYDLGFRDEAVHWFYAAQYRARLFEGVLDPGKVGGMGSTAFELSSAHSAFQELVGPHLNGYAGCDRKKWLAVLESVEAANKSVPDLAGIYPSVAFIPTDQWAAKNAEVAQGLRKLAEYLETQWSEFKASRAQNNMDEKFCSQ